MPIQVRVHTACRRGRRVARLLASALVSWHARSASAGAAPCEGPDPGGVGCGIEPAALAAGLAFHPLEAHAAELWVAEDWLDEPGVRRLREALTSQGLARRLEAVGGYDLAGCGTAVGA